MLYRVYLVVKVIWLILHWSIEDPDGKVLPTEGFQLQIGKSWPQLVAVAQRAVAQAVKTKAACEQVWRPSTSESPRAVANAVDRI